MQEFLGKRVSHNSFAPPLYDNEGYLVGGYDYDRVIIVGGVVTKGKEGTPEQHSTVWVEYDEESVSK